MWQGINKKVWSHSVQTFFNFNERMIIVLYQANSLKGHKLNSKEGEIGTVKEFYFDDQFWAIRYLVADTGSWLPGRKVLISPYALVSVNEKDGQVNVNLSKKQIEDSPALDSDKPVSRQFEADYYGYYGWPEYWGGQNMWGLYPFIVRDTEKWKESKRGEKGWDPHLRSTHDVTGYHIQATNDEVGHVEDFIIDDATWAIRYLVINTKNWWAGKKVLVSPRWIDHISWPESKVFINLSREAVKESPEYSEETLTRDYETGLHIHYNRQGYWDDE